MWRPPTAQPEGAGAPVAGHILQAYGAATVAGPAQGISYGAAPGARVTVPCASTVLFAGAFPAYGHVVIAGCGTGTSVVLAGMARLDVATGEHLAYGQPVGEMPGYDPAAPPANRSFMSSCAGTARRWIPPLGSPTGIFDHWRTRLWIKAWLCYLIICDRCRLAGRYRAVRIR